MGRKTLREQFEDSYTAVPVPADNADGFTVKYIYYAPWYRWDVPRDRLRRTKAGLLALSTAGVVLNVAAMSRSTSANSMTAVFLVYAVLLCAHVMEFSGLFRFLAAKEKTTKMDYEEISRCLETFPVIRAGAGLAAAAVCLYFVGKGNEVLLHSFMMTGYLASAVLAAGVAKGYGRIPVTVEENDSLEKYDSLEKKIAAR